MEYDRDKFVWFQSNIAIISVLCWIIWVITNTSIFMATYGAIAIYFACLAIWNMQQSQKEIKKGK